MVERPPRPAARPSPPRHCGAALPNLSRLQSSLAAAAWRQHHHHQQQQQQQQQTMGATRQRPLPVRKSHSRAERQAHFMASTVSACADHLCANRRLYYSQSCGRVSAHQQLARQRLLECWVRWRHCRADLSHPVLAARRRAMARRQERTHHSRGLATVAQSWQASLRRRLTLTLKRI